MKLQLALDDLNLEEALALTEKVREYIDIIEIGTPFVYQEGMNAVKIFKESFPEKEVLADMKIMDAGYYESEEALKVGADYITVLGVTDNLTIRGCIEAAEHYGKEVVVDMICVPDLPKRIRERAGSRAQTRAAPSRRAAPYGERRRSHEQEGPRMRALRSGRSYRGVV